MPDPVAQRAAQRPPQRPPQRRVIYTGTNRFDFDKSRVPEGMTYGWKRISVAGGEDTEHKILCEMNGWTPVPANRHPELAGRNPTDAPIVRGGLMLMELPTPWAEESRALDEFSAKHTLEEQIQRIDKGSKRQGAKGIKRGMEVIPELVE